MLMTLNTVGVLGSALLILGICCLLTLCLYAFIILDTQCFRVLLKPAGAQGSQGAQGPLVAQLSYY